MRIVRGREPEPSREENIAQWWLLPDPLAEWRYGISPYAFCSNNPINRTDPDGRFDTKLGAWLYKKLKGGDAILTDAATGKFFVSQRHHDNKKDVEVTRVFKWSDGKSSRSGSGSSGMEGVGGKQKSGLTLTQEGGGASPTKQQATEGSGGQVDITNFPTFGRAGKITPGRLNTAEGLNSVTEAITTDRETTPKDPNDTSDLVPDKNTDASGKPVDNRDAYPKSYPNQINSRGYYPEFPDSMTWHEINPSKRDTFKYTRENRREQWSFKGRYN